VAEPLPDLTICVAGLGPLETTRRFLRSVFDTAGPVALEVFVINSVTQEESAALDAEFPDLAVVGHDPARFLNTTINQVISRSRGRYFSVWDSGTVVSEGCLLNLVEFLDETPDAGVAGPKIRNDRGQIQQVARTFPSFLSLLFATEHPPGRPAVGWNEYAAGEADWFAGPGITFSRLLTGDIGGIHPNLSLYWPIEFCLRAHRAGWHVHYLNDAQATGSLAAWQRTLSMGRDISWRRLWEACLLTATWRFR
jgi:N-acetylglucosaminyl-diphospho-decaprenol L-rhamnosyltransferase